MKYKIGDKVKIAEKTKIENHPLTCNSMGNYAGKIVTIQDIEDKYDKTYFIREDTNKYCWPEELLSLYAIYDGEEELMGIKNEKESNIEDKIRILEDEAENINKKINRYREIARQKFDIEKIINDVISKDEITINGITISQLNFPDCSEDIHTSIANTLVAFFDRLNIIAEDQ